MRTLHTPRCTLAPQVAGHAEAMFQVLSDPAIYEFENAPPVSLDWPGPPAGGGPGSIDADEICFHRPLITAGAATTGPATPC